ncbi:hypothetical protein [Streptomyces zaomyceticus]|uniref:hypothetical protein n=1 Tax=Streptomyces zaomyceticus TaxID=68286 RepID=UPI00339F2777
MSESVTADRSKGMRVVVVLLSAAVVALVCGIIVSALAASLLVAAGSAGAAFLGTAGLGMTITQYLSSHS